MSILDRILGRTAAEAPQILAPGKAPAVTEVPAAAVTPAGSAAPAIEGVVRVYDQFGRKVEIGRESWRANVLLPNLASNRDQPDVLLGLIAAALDDGFAVDVLDAARHLAEHDPQPARGAALLGAVLLQTGDVAGARAVLERAISRHGETPWLLATLAHAFAAAGENERSQTLIWRALALDPNAEGALNFAVANAKGDALAVLTAYERAAALPGSWRAQLWLARHALEFDQVEDATRLYEQALARIKPAPADLLMQMSGDLGNRGQIELLVRLTQPRFDLAAHGLTVGNNLLRAYVDLGMFAEARNLLEQLYSQQRADWREHLIDWEQRLDDAQKRYGEVTAPLEIVVMKLDEPVWARGVLGFESMLPAKDAGAPRIHFLCGSAQSQEGGDGKVVSQPTNDLGRLARALPMFLCEEIYLRTQARTAFLLPWMKQGGFILSAKPWTRAFLPPDDSPPDLFVFLHIDATAAPWQLLFSIETAQGGSTPLEFKCSFDLANAGHDVLALLYELIPRLATLLPLPREAAIAALGTPSADILPAYLTGIEQALALSLAARHAGTDNFLHQERSIVDHLFDVALRGGDLLRPRLLLVNALENEARRRPDIVREYLGKLSLLQQQHGLPSGPGVDLITQGIRTVVGKVNA